MSSKYDYFRDVEANNLFEIIKEKVEIIKKLFSFSEDDDFHNLIIEIKKFIQLEKSNKNVFMNILGIYSFVRPNK